MAHWLIVTILGIIEGLTEFIPVSSTGHLLIAEHWLPRQSDLFNVVIQCGAVAAALPFFRDRFKMLARLREPASRSLLAKIAVAFAITVAGGLVLKKYELPTQVAPVATALIVGGIAFIGTEFWLRGRNQIAGITWRVAIAVGVAQLVAILFPGASRSGSTIIFALLLGTTRVEATEFSFLVGIPSLFAAGAYKLMKALKGGVHEDWAMLGLSTVVAAIVSFIAVKWLLRFVQSHSFIGFGVYRIIVGVVLLLWLGWQ